MAAKAPMSDGTMASEPLTRNSPDLLVKLRQVAEDMRGAAGRHAQGFADEAEATCRKLLETIPKYAPALRLLGLIEMERGKPERAKLLLAEIFPALATDPDAHIQYGTALALSGEREAAADAFRRAIGLRSDDANAHARLGGVLSEMGRFDAAIASCRAALAL